MNTLLKLVAVASVLSACVSVQPPASPAEKSARIYASANHAFENCGQFMMGGFSSAMELKRVRDQQYAMAKKLGANDVMFTQARADVNSTFANAAIWTSPAEACNALVTAIAQAS